MLKVAQQNTIPFNNLTKNINYQLLIETHSRRRKEKKGRYRRSDSDQKDSDTELFIAIRKKNQSEEKKLERIKQIFKEHPKPNVKAQYYKGNMDTPLHMVVRLGYLKIVNFLIQNGGDNDLSNEDGNTPLMLARQLGHLDIITALERAMPYASQLDNTISKYLNDVQRQDAEARKIFNIEENKNLLPISDRHYLILGGSIGEEVPVGSKSSARSESEEFKFSNSVNKLVKDIILSFDETFREILKLDETFLKILKSDKKFREILIQNEKFSEILTSDEKFLEILESDEMFLKTLESNRDFREFLTSDEKFFEMLESDEILCEVLKYNERFFEKLKSDVVFLKTLKSNKKFSEILTQNEKFSEILTSADKVLLKKLISDEKLREVLESDKRFFEILRSEEEIRKKLKSSKEIKIPDNKNFLFYVIKDEKNKLKEILVAISGAGISFRSGIVKEAAMSGQKRYSKEFEKFQNTLNSVVKNYGIKGTLVPFSRKEERAITKYKEERVITKRKDNDLFYLLEDAFKNFEKKFEQDGYTNKMSLIAKILQGDILISHHLFNTLSESRLESLALFYADFNEAKLIARKIKAKIRNEKFSNIEESITIKLLEKIEEKQNTHENQEKPKFESDDIEKNIEFLKKQSRIIYLDKFREEIDGFINSEKNKIDIDRYIESLKKTWKQFNKMEVFNIIQYQARCSEDNLIDYLSYNSDILKKKGKHYIFSIEKVKGISKKTEYKKPIRPPCSYCILHFPLELSIIASSKAGLPIFNFKNRLEVPKSVDNLSIKEKLLYLSSNAPESYLKNIFNKYTFPSDKFDKSYLTNAVKRNMKYVLQEALNFKSYNGGLNKALYDAALVGSIDVIDYLIKEKDVSIDFKIEQENGNTALHAAVNNNHIESVKILLKSAINQEEKIKIISKPNNDGVSPLHLAAQHKKYKEKSIFEFLIEVIPNGEKDKYLEDKLRISYKNDDPYLNPSHFGPLYAAVESSNKEMVEYIWELQKNKLPLQKTIIEQDVAYTPLHIASMRGDYEIVDFLVTEGFFIKNIDSYKRHGIAGSATALNLAIHRGHEEVSSFLLEEMESKKMTENIKRSIEFSNGEPGTTALHELSVYGFHEIIKKLLSKINKGEKKKAVQAIDKRGMTPLHFAAAFGHEETVTYLLNNDALVYSLKNHLTPLHFASIGGYKKVVESLLNKSPNTKSTIEAEGKTGQRPLHSAAATGRLEVIKYLLEQGADIEAKARGVRALHLAAENGYEEIVEILLDNYSKKDTTIGDKFKKFINDKVEEKNDWTSLHYAALNGHRNVVELLLNKGADIESITKERATPLHIAALQGHKDVVQLLLKKNADIEAKAKDQSTPLHLAALMGHPGAVKELLEWGADADAKTNNGETASILAGKNKHREVVSLIIKHINERHSSTSPEHLEEVVTQTESVGLEVVADASADCAPRRRRRELSRCSESEEREQFPYEPLEESDPVAERQVARLYSQLALADAWQQGSSPDNLVRYQRYLGDILEEGEANQSPREQRLVHEHYQQALGFFQNHPKPTLLEAQADDFEPLAGHSVLLKNGQQSLLVFNEGPRYQLYSPDFNYRQRFHTKPGVSWAEMSAFIQAFFQWKTGRRDCHVLTLQELPAETLKLLREAPFWHPETLAPDSVLLAREQAGLIEGIPARVVRELVRVKGQVVEASALHADFFQHTDGIQLRVENLHTVLGELTTEQRQALVQVVRKYQWSADSTLLESLDAEAQPLFADYQQQVMTELKTAETLTPERLSEFSWRAMEQAFNKHPDISPELTQQTLTHLKELQATSAKRAWAKGMATQTLFFLPDMIRAANTGQVDGLVRMGGMLVADSSVNHLYSNLLERLTPTLSEARLGLLRKLPITSPVFKALTVYSIAELTQQLQSLPADSEQRNTIKHRLGEQYVTAGLMVAELFGWELGPLWVALIAEQLIFEAITFRKENQLDIPLWEALIMSLGFEQAKLQNIFEERQLVELNLGLVNNINSQLQLQTPYGLVLVRVPTLGPLMWNDIDESQVPSEIRRQILQQPEPSPSLISGTAIREAGGFQQLFEHVGNVQGVDETGTRTRKRLVRSYWKRGNYTVQATPITVHWTPSGRRSHQEDNIFRQELTIPQGVNSTFERRVAVAGSDYQAVVAHSPIQITGEGLAALYAVKQPPATTASQKNLFLGFDPREGDISLEMSSSGWKALTRDYRGAPPSTSFTVQVGPKGYPPMILFQPNLGVLRVEDKSRRLHGDYVISSDSTPFYLYDDTLTTRIAITPPSDRPIGFMVRSYDLSMLQLQTWSPKRSQSFPALPPDRNPVELKKALQALLPQQISLLHLPNKQYLQLMLHQQLIAGVLTLAAEQVEVLYAKGQEAYQSGIFMTSGVTNFTVTLLGHLQIMQGSTHLFFIGEVPKAELIRYSKTPSAPHLTVYQLELPALQPVLESLSRPNPQEIQFSTPGLNYAWVPGVEHPSALKIIGPYQGQPAQLLLEHRRSILSELTGHRPRKLVVDHYNPHATLDSQLLLQQVIPGGGESHLAYLDGRCDSLLFQSAEGYSVIHRFPAQQTLTLNGIDYQVIGKQLYAIGAPNGVIDGEQLIRTRTANRRVAIRLNSSLAESTLSRDQDTLTINQLTLRHLPNQTPIYLSEQAFPLKALKESIHRQRHRRELPSAKPLASGAAQNKPWGNQLMKQVVTLLGGVHWEWPTLFSWGNSMSQKPAILNSGQPTPKGLQTVGEYTVGHLQGGLQLVDLLVRKITGERYQQLATCAPTPLTEAEARLASLQQQYASFSSHDNLAANPYRGHRVDMLSTPQWTATPINRD